MKTLKQTGFSLVGAVLLLVVVVVVALAGWVVYQRVRHPATTAGTTSQQNPSTTQHSGDTSAQQPQASLFRIPELGIELTAPNSLKDLQYAVDTTAVHGTTFVRFTSATLQATDGSNSQCTAAQSALGVMWKTASNPADTGAAATASKKVGDAYVLYSRPQQGCSNRPATNQLQQSQAKLLEAAVQTARAI